MDELALINAVRQGDLDAFNMLILQYQGFLFNIALRMMGSEDSAADALQDALLSAFRKFNSFRGGSLRSWLARVVINACYDELRRQCRHPLLLLDQVNAEKDEMEIDDWLIDPVPGLEEQIETLELDGAIQDGLRSLAPLYAAMLVLVDIEGMTYEEAAVAAHIPVGTVKSRLARARMQMRQALLPYEEPFCVSYQVGFSISMKV
jgi:RNA polymerase sigma factor (sigma-70 family)